MRDMPCSYAGYDSFVCLKWFMDMCDVTHSHKFVLSHSYMCHNSRTTRSCVWRDYCICLAWRIHTYDPTHSYVCIYMFELTYSNVRHDSPLIKAHVVLELAKLYRDHAKNSRFRLWPVHAHARPVRACVYVNVCVCMCVCVCLCVCMRAWRMDSFKDR